MHVAVSEQETAPVSRIRGKRIECVMLERAMSSYHDFPAVQYFQDGHVGYA
jgi:hypothetical protein